MGKILKFLMALLFLIVGTSVEANVFQENRSEEYLQNKSSTGSNTFRIRQQVNHRLQSEGLKAEDYQLVGVTLHAKSRTGEGLATLILGEQKDPRPVLTATDGDFLNNQKSSFQVIEWDLASTPTEASHGVWQLQLDGHLKIMTMEVHLRSKMEIVLIRLGHLLIGTHPDSQTDRIEIKELLKDRGYWPKDFTLKAVRTLVKSKDGHGKAQLFIGNSNKGSHSIAQGINDDFENSGPQSFNPLNWLGLNASAPGNLWEIRFKGHNRGKQLVVALKPLFENEY